MSTGIKEKVLQEIIDIAQKHGIIKVMLFGSRARGDYHRASDIDLAVSGKNIINFTLDIKEKTSTLLEFDIIDLENELQESFRNEIMKEGVTIYEKI